MGHEPLPPWDIVLASAVAFVAGLVDSIIGGGGLAQVPALFVLFPHFPVPMVIGTNRLASVVGTSIAALRYARGIVIPWRVVVAAGGVAAVLSFTGAKLSSLLPPTVIKPVILLLMSSIALYTYRRKTLGQNDNVRWHGNAVFGVGAGIGAVTGFYNGFVGPGTGSLLVFGFVGVMGYSFLKASAVSKSVNVIADVSSLIFFVGGGFVRYDLALPMTLMNAAGSFVGSRLAIARGSGFVRIAFLAIVAALIARFAYDIVAGR